MRDGVRVSSNRVQVSERVAYITLLPNSLHQINNLPQIRTRRTLLLTPRRSGLPTDIPPLQRLPVQRTKQLSPSAFVTSARVPRLEGVFLREGHVGDEEYEGVEVGGCACFGGGVGEGCEDLLEGVGRYEAC